MWFLSDAERNLALKNEFISQPLGECSSLSVDVETHSCLLAVTASMLSRSGMMCFLYTCFSSVDKQIRLSIIICMAIQVVVNSVTAVQIIVQCGPNPYHAVGDLLSLVPVPGNS
jgi:Na+-translocating ferredoxin:NAD+ oxidoreductase RnfE subunit